MKIAKSCVCCGSDRLQRSPAVLMPFIASRVFGWESVEITPEWNMRDLPLGHTQAMCNTLRCEDCGLIFLDMRFDEEELGALYADYRGPAYSAARERLEPGYGNRNGVLKESFAYVATIEAILARYVCGAPRVLDWGGDTGLNTPFRGRAAIHHVYDISNKPPVAGAEVVDRAQIRAGAYDLVVSSNVLEHVSAPGEHLGEIASALAPDTVLYLEVPHEDAIRLVPDRRAGQARKRHWHEHINFFTDEALDAMLARAGLEQKARVSHPVSVAGRTCHVFSIVAQREGLAMSASTPPAKHQDMPDHRSGFAMPGDTR